VKRRVLTEHQYEELRGYEDGRPRWRNRSPSKSLTRAGLLEIVPGSGHDRASSMFRITGAGRRGLAGFRERYGVPV
jgi:hypothetical protein